MSRFELPIPQWLPEDIGCRDGILNGEVDAHAANGRHGMGSVADEQESRLVPLPQPVDADAEQLHIIPGLDVLTDADSGPRQDFCHLCAKSVEPALPHGIRRALRNDDGALPVAAPVDLDQKAAWFEVPDAFRRISRRA